MYLISEKKMTAKTPKVQSVPTGPTEAKPAQDVQLTISDLQLVSRVIDLASRRGAFQAAEMSQVGDIYNKLTAFLSQVEKGNAEPQTPTPV